MVVFILFASSFCVANVRPFIVKGDYNVVDSLKKVVAASTDRRELIRANNYLGAYYEGISNYKSALDHLYRSDKLNKGDYPEERVLCYDYLGYIYWHKSYYKLALNYHDKALVIAQEISISCDKIAFTYMMLGSDYYDLGEYEQTSKFYFRALQEYEQLNDHVGRIMIHNRLSKLYYKLKDYKRSLEKAKKRRH